MYAYMHIYLFHNYCDSITRPFLQVYYHICGLTIGFDIFFEGWKGLLE